MIATFLKIWGYALQLMIPKEVNWGECNVFEKGTEFK